MSNETLPKWQQLFELASSEKDPLKLLETITAARQAIFDRANAGVRHVVVIALTAEGIPATLKLTIGANRRSAVRASSHGSLSARHTCVAVT